MAQLHENWFTQGTLDFELKKYTLLAYLRDVRNEFRSTRLYPPFADLLTHYRKLESFKRGKEQLASEFPKTLKGVDWEKLRLVHEQAESQGQEMAEIDEIVEYALPEMRNVLDEGKAVYEWVEQKMELGVVGVLPLQLQEGYLLTRMASHTEVKAYHWRTTVYEEAHERFRSLRTHLVGTFQYGLGSTFEHIKLSLIRSHREMPNPATYCLVSQLDIPEEATFLPVARRLLMRVVAA